MIYWSFCLPISVISRLKSPHITYAWLGWELICLVLVVCMMGMRGKSFSCDGIYMFISIHGWSG